ncbi:MAG: hypothetical protein G01um101418_943 [Parcubacteria group bacterium Gr01-1014_18]|nr:MAG: hypothetical protein Greene041636_945 [Parcubacteria group bacterium Greene0416_36]TSC79682.1 MAG: hypothetical protein G01um101418_943 [Parcubacteria group bacterium Gr01-1014_18]TSC97870.1 MAG: hypothetical protein Greene101420_975 [Parcubacteria group bacterium Greene1014_20]TSD06494.1 MAG: hypothetical protein Greene07142_875 [Parcubacteria group bacterium Greene0714_2]
MTAQIVFKTDKKVKELTQRKIRQEGTTLTAFFNQCMKDYMAGKIKTGLIYSEPEIEIMKVTPFIQVKMDRIARL